MHVDNQRNVIDAAVRDVYRGLVENEVSTETKISSLDYDVIISNIIRVQ